MSQCETGPWSSSCVDLSSSSIRVTRLALPIVEAIEIVSNMSTVVFLHGLNTYGDDDLHLGPLRFGRMHKHLEREFQSRDVDFIPVTGLGAGRPEILADRAIAFLTEMGFIDSQMNHGESSSVHLLGQSVGGLVARAMAATPELRSRTKSVITIGTPHSGTPAAHHGMEFSSRHPLLHRAAQRLGYDASEKAEVFRCFTPEALEEFNGHHPSITGIEEVSLICEAKGEDVALPLKVLFGRLLKELFEPGAEPSDGFITSASQKWGRAIGPFALDHFAQFGFFMHLSPQARLRADREFQRMLQAIMDVIVMTASRS